METMIFSSLSRTSWLSAFAILSASALAAPSDQRYPLKSVDLITEIYFIASPQFRGLTHRGDWFELKARANDNWSATITSYQLRDRNLLDETYIQYEDRASVVKAGRLRGIFGFGKWSDLFYNVISRSPMVRMLPVLDQYNLQTFTSGGEYHLYKDGFDFGLQVGDGNLSDRQFLPTKTNVIQGRAQMSLADSQVGLNVAKVDRGPLSAGGEVYGLDFRRIANRVQVRAEVVGSRGSGVTGKGYYADFSYRLPGNQRTQVGIRLEEYAMGDTSTRLMTAGVRFVPLPQLAVNLNYGWTPGFGIFDRQVQSAYTPPPGYGGTLMGWSFQTMLTYRFKS